jgi:alpha-methylacyl-CoA racemase
MLMNRNPKLIIARLTGYGQEGPLSRKAGHDLNYIAISGILSLFGPSDSAPAFPINLLGDFAGGSLFCVIGILLAIISRSKTGKGAIIDAAMIDGVMYLATFILKMKQFGFMNDLRGTNLLDGGVLLLFLNIGTILSVIPD